LQIFHFASKVYKSAPKFFNLKALIKKISIKPWLWKYCMTAFLFFYLL